MEKKYIADRYGNASKSVAPIYLDKSTGGGTISGGPGGESYDPYIYIKAGEDVFAGQVIQVATVTENDEKVKRCFIQNSQRPNHNQTVGIVVKDCDKGEKAQIQHYGEFDYQKILQEKELPIFTGSQLFCVNNDTATNINVSNKLNVEDNHIIKIGKLVDNTKVLIDIAEYIN